MCRGGSKAGQLKLGQEGSPDLAPDPAYSLTRRVLIRQVQCNIPEPNSSVESHIKSYENMMFSTSYNVSHTICTYTLI